MQDKNSTQYYYDLIKNAQTKEERERIQHQIMNNKEESFVSVFNRCMAENNIAPVDIISKTKLLLSNSVVYHYLDGQRHPTRDRALVLILAGKFNLDQAARCLKALEYNNLRPKYPREAIIMECIINGDDPARVNDILCEKGFKELVPLKQ